MKLAQCSGEVLCKKVHGAQGPDNIRRLLSAICPDLGDYAVNFIYGEIYSDNILSLEEREMINIAALVVDASHLQLKTHILSAYYVGCSPKKIIATILQMLIVTGFPKVVNAMLLAQEVFDENKIKIV
jgi:4-carboxymuconolactone decarboxylase